MNPERETTPQAGATQQAQPDEFKKLLEKTHRPGGVFEDAGMFEHAQRVAKMLITSPLVPPAFKGQENLGSAVIAVDIASRLNLNPLLVMQQLYLVYGKPGWSAQFVIATINSSGMFSRLRFDIGSQGDDRGCVCFATDKASGETLRSSRIDIAMAKKQGWWDKKDSKWPVMTDQMLMYRAAAFWGRAYAPELLMGLPTVEEIEDTSTEPAPSRPIFKEPTAPITAIGETISQVPKPGENAPTILQNVRPKKKKEEPAAPAPTPPAPTPATAAAPTPAPAEEERGGFNPIKAMRMLLKSLKLEERDIIDFWLTIGAVTGDPLTLEPIALTNPDIIQSSLDNWDDISKRLIAAKQGGGQSA